MLTKPKNRYQAFAVHIGISAIIFLVLAAIIVFVWYPGFLFETDGGWEGIRLIAGVDFVIGPLLTLIVYKVGKPSLKFDLTLIGIVQIVCLAIGCWLVYEERPLAVIYANGTFHTMSGGSFEINEIDQQEVLKLDDQVPAWIYVDLPQEKEKRSEIIMRQLQDGPVHIQTDLYKPYDDHIDKVIAEAIDISTLDKEMADQVSAAGKLFKLRARYASGKIEIDKDNGEYIALHDIKSGLSL